MYYQKIRVRASDHEERMVPKFFREMWAEKHNGEDPFENKKQYNKENDSIFKWWKMGISFFTGVSFFTTCVVMVVMFVFSFEPNKTITQIEIAAGKYIGLIILILLFPVTYWAWKKSLRRWKACWHHKRFFQEVLDLFNLFEIEPSTSIGNLSKEEFAGLVAGSLRAQMEIVDTKHGFARFPDYEQFKRMHAAALEWGLCKEKYDEYDPKKVGK